MNNKLTKIKKNEKGEYIVRGTDLGDSFDKFCTYIQSHGDEIEEDETFLQCTSTVEDLKYFNPDWFVSNKARVLSFASGEPKFLIPQRKPDKKKYGYVRNTYSNKWTPIHRLVALYHGFDGKGEVPFEKLDVHHAYSNDGIMSVEEFNSMDNIQLLTRDRHSVLTKVEKAGESFFNSKFEKAERELKVNKGVISLNTDDLKNLLIKYVSEHDDAYIAIPREDGTLERIKYLTLEDIK